MKEPYSQVRECLYLRMCIHPCNIFIEWPKTKRQVLSHKLISLLIYSTVVPLYYILFSSYYSSIFWFINIKSNNEVRGGSTHSLKCVVFFILSLRIFSTTLWVVPPLRITFKGIVKRKNIQNLLNI